ncbi:MAG: stage V sporulation protein T [Firmicutes bacterium]|nr:stage V sporulation protein T [Bacillota bacterium]MBO2520502.1 stage V sporulation protein T [Bacillota bacterium]
MKATGIVRRIDDLGRIVIPKEIRRTLRIRERDALEIFTDRDGEVILKKYSPIADLEDFAQEYADSLFESTGHVALITDRDAYIAVAGTGRKAFLGKSLPEELAEAMEARRPFLSQTAGYQLPIQGFEEASQVLVPIVHDGEVVGSVILLSKEKTLGDLETTLCQTAADFLAKQLG